MRNHNSRNNGFYTQLLVSIHHDMVGAISTQNEISRDAEEIRRRVNHEGVTFLTKTLPALGKSIDVSLATGTPLSFSGFKTAKGTALPAFMRTAFEGVFRADGVPWFATWYTDICAAFEGQADMITDNTVRESERIDKITCDEIHSYLTTAENKRKFNVDWCVYTFPGMHVLREMPDGHKIVSAISVGKSPVRTLPDHSDVVLNRRREAMVVALKALRQVCFCFYKLNIPYTHEQESKVLEDFVATDKGLDYKVSTLAGKEKIILKRARGLIGRVLANADPLSGLPRHGRGAVATGEKSFEKHTFKRFYRRLNVVFSYDEWFFLNSSHLCDSLQELQAMESLEYGTAKVVLVPKDSRGPRLISEEPLEYQWIQQALNSVLVDTIEAHPLTKGLVNFSHQSINRGLAAKGSHWPYSQVTLDMKEASDRVSLELVCDLFPERWAWALYASRSPETRLPCGTIVPMKKFAPMGSAVCFPVEALIFWALSAAAIEVMNENLGHVEAPTKVYVYGDDIVCDAYYHGEITSILPKFGLMLNDRKCCTAGPFKESCGMDAFLGHSVTPTKIRSEWVKHPKSGGLASYVAYANAFYRDGLLESAEYLRGQLQDLMMRSKMYPIPTINSGEPSVLAFVMGDVNVRHYNSTRYTRFNLDKQRMEVAGYTCVPESKMTRDEGWSLCTRILASVETSKEPDDLLRSVVPQTLKTGQYAIVHRNKLTRTWMPLT